VRRRAAPGLVGLLALGAALLFADLGRMDALDTTDARYLEIAREMRASGDALLPTLAGVPHLDKPPLAYWAAAAGFALFGLGELGGRFFAQVALLAAVATVVLHARRWLPSEWAGVGGLGLLASPLAFGDSRALSTDLFQLGFLTGALLLLYEGALGRGSSWRVALAFALLGASMLAKGPIALMVAAAIVAPWLALERGRARMPLAGVALGLVLFAAIGLPWYGFLIAGDPSRLEAFALEQLVGRAMGGGEGHPHGPAYYLWSWPLLLLPWTPIAAVAVWRNLRRAWRGEADPLDHFLLLWALAPVVLFSLFATKLLSYLLPAVPGTALLVARAGARGWLEDAAGRRALRVAAGALALAALGATLSLAARGPLESSLLARVALRRLAHPDLVAALLAAVALAAGGVAMGRLRPRDAAQGAVGLGLGTAACMGLGFHALAPALPSVREPAELVRRVPDARLVQHGTFSAAMLFYTGATRRSYVAATSHFCEPPQDTDRGRALCLHRRDTLAMLRDPAPAFAWVHPPHAAALAEDTGARPLYESRRGVLLANAAARERLAGALPSPGISP
jgi:4-amino-4-deoxy-L-arabinose transferase